MNNLDNVNFKVLNQTTEYGNKLEDTIQAIVDGSDYGLGTVEEA